MFVVQDMLTEAAIVAVILAVVLLSLTAIAVAARESRERHQARVARERSRRRAWDEYSAACLPLPVGAARVRPTSPSPREGTCARPVREGRAGLSVRPVKI